MNLSENIKKIRKENNLSQEALAEQLGVSRQSVSKWESGQAYPEMDKVLQICDLFNLNMDELMKSDLKEVRENKQSKANINKFVDDLFSFITKTIEMFGSLKFNDKIKCLFEQGFIALCLFVIFLIIGTLFSEVFNNLFGFINGDVYWALYSIFRAIYLLVASFISLAIFFHVFKIRYLDYYVFVKENTKEQEEIIEEVIEVTPKENNKKETASRLTKKQERIVIRDPHHSGYKFLSGLIKCALFFIKVVAFLIGIIFILTLLALSFFLVIPFLYSKAKFLFWGSIISILASMIVNLAILKLLLNFIISKKTSKNLISIVIALCVVLLGIGGGVFALGITNVNYIEGISKEEIIIDKYELTMKEDLILEMEQYKNNIEYIESSNQNVIVEIEHSQYINVHYYEYASNEIGIYTYLNEYKIFDLIKAYAKDLNNYEIRDREYALIRIYTTKENIVKLKNNREKNYNRQLTYEREIQDIYNYYEKIIQDYQIQISNLNDRINYLEENY